MKPIATKPLATKPLAVLVLGLTGLGLATVAKAGQVRIEATGPLVELRVSQTVNHAPDMVRIGAGVQTRAPSAREAMQQNARAMTRVIARLKSLGVAAKDIQTSNISLNPQYRYDQPRQKQIFTGYQASNQLTVKLHDLKRVGAVLDALVAAGATSINGPAFALENDEAVKDKARTMAFARGKAMALQYARMAGFSGVKLLEVSESFTSRGPVPMMAERAMVADASAVTPIEAGEVVTGVNITVKYQMQ